MSCHCATHDRTFAAVAELLTHIRDVHSRPTTGGTADRLLADWSADVGRR